MRTPSRRSSSQHRVSSSSSSKLRAAGSSNEVPGYAQPTISFSQRSSVRLKTDHTLKAGAGKQSRPSSMSALKPKLQSYPISNSNSNSKSTSTSVAASPVASPKTPTSKKRPSFIQIFSNNHSPKQEIKRKPYNGVESPQILPDIDITTHRSSSYRSPSLVNRVGLGSSANAEDTNNSDLNLLSKIIKETDELIETMGVGDDFFPYRELEQMKESIKAKRDVPIEQCENWIKNYSAMVTKFQEKIYLDHKLIQNILELNNYISKTCRLYEAKIEESTKEIEELKKTVELYDYHYGDHENTVVHGHNDSFFQITTNLCDAERQEQSLNNERFALFKNSTDLKLNTAEIETVLSQFTIDSGQEPPESTPYPYISSTAQGFRDSLMSSDLASPSVDTDLLIDKKARELRNVYHQVYNSSSCHQD